MMACVIASITALVVFHNSLNAGFVYDDSQAILTNPDVKPTTPMTEMWKNDFWGVPLSSKNSHGSYRPLCVLSYRLNYWACGLRPWGYHLGNVLLHGLATSLVYRTGAVLGLTGTGAASMIFAVHPIHTEAVAGLVGRADVLSTIFFLLSFLTYTRHVSARELRHGIQRGKGRPHDAIVQWVYLWASLGLAACAMLCKETGITVLAVCAIYDIILHRHSLSLRLGCGAIKSLCWLGAGLVVLLVCRLQLLGLTTPTFATSDNPIAKHPSFIARSLTFFYLPAFNGFLMVCPKWLSFDWSMEAIPRIESFMDARNLYTILFYGFFYIGCSSCIRALKTTKIAKKITKPKKCRGCGQGCGQFHSKYCKTVNNNNNNYPAQQCQCNVTPKLKRESEALLMAISILVLPFLPATNLFFYVGFVVAERILYLPSVGYCLLLGVGYGRMSRYTLPKIALAILVLSYSARTYLRNIEWQDEESLYRSGIPINPPKAYGNLGSVLSSQGRTDEAETAFRIALEYRPNMADVHYNLGILLHGKGMYPEAIKSYQQAIRFRPSLALAHLNLGTLLATQGRVKDAETVLIKCSRLDGSTVKDPRTHEATRVSALVHLGRLYADRGDHDKAVRVYSQAIALRPADYQPQVLYNMLGESLGKQGRPEEAERWFKAALTVKPDHVPAHLTYGKLLAKNRTRESEAEQWFIRAKKLAPKDPTVYFHFGEFMSERQRYAEAAKLYVRATELAPDQYESVIGAATALRHSGKKKEAEMFYRKAVKLKPKDSTSYTNLGAILHMNGKRSEAVDAYREALRLNPADQTAVDNLNKLQTGLSSL